MLRDNEMQNLVEIKEEVKGDIALGMVNEAYCVDLYNKGNLISGYALWLAKTEVHKDSQTGWEKFCKKIGVSESNANRAIDFYNAKSTPIGVDLPSKEGTFRALPSGTVEEKAEFYAEVKELSQKEDPTAQDISITKKIKGAYKVEANALKDIKIVLEKATPKVKIELDKRLGKKGVTEIITLIEKGASEEKVLEAFHPKPKLPDAPTKCPKLKEQNSELRAKNKELEKEIKELRAFKESTNSLEQFSRDILQIGKFVATLQREDRYKKAFIQSMSTELKDALEFMELEMEDIDSLTMDTLKKQYRKMAKAMHPDAEYGSDALFIGLDKAYNALQTLI